MFGQVLDKLENYFGRAFLLTRYVPWLLCVAVNGAIACIEFPEVRAFAVEEIRGFAASKAVDLFVGILLIWVVAYATAPIVEAMTNILEGGWIPRWVAWFLIASQASRREQLNAEYTSLFTRRLEMPKAEHVVARLLEDRAIGSRLRTITDTRAIKRAEKLVANLRVKRWFNRPVSRAEFNAMKQALSEALKLNCADKDHLLRREDTRRFSQRWRHPLLRCKHLWRQWRAPAWAAQLNSLHDRGARHPGSLCARYRRAIGVSRRGEAAKRVRGA